MLIVNALSVNHDKEDFIDSIQRYVKKDGPKEETNPSVLEVEAIARFGKFEPVIVQFVKEKIQENDAKLRSIYGVYQHNYDRDDFIHSINRYYAKCNK